MPPAPVFKPSRWPRVVASSRALAALRHGNFRLYFAGQAASQVGSWMQIIGQAWLVLQLTRSGLQLGLVGALQALPILLFALVGGIFADRWPKRRVLLATQAASALQAAALWVLIATATVQVWHVYVLALLLGITNSLGRPASRAFVVELVGREDAPNGVALNSSVANLARIVGPGLGGVVIAARGVSALFLVNALSFLPVILALALMDGRRFYARPQRDAGAASRPTSTWQSAREGLGYVWRTPSVLLVIVVVGLALLFGSNFNVVLPLFATEALRTDAAGFGWLSAALGVGALLATLWLVWVGRAPTIRRMLAFTLAFGASEALLVFSPLVPSAAGALALAVALLAGVGFAEETFATLALTLLQTESPDALRGRVMSVATLFFDGSVPIGYLLVGWLAGVVGPAMTLVTCGALSLLTAAGGWWWRRRIPTQKLRDF